MKTIDLKFRAWHTKLKEWHYYHFLHLLSMECVPQYTNGKAITVSKFDYEHWCQYIGKEDSNGVEIYTGDVYEHFTEPYFSVEETQNGDYQKWIDKGRQMLRHTKTVTHVCQEIRSGAVVIGNIFTDNALSL